ncbi:mismatch-specific DNA-glycosylase [Acuticoccus mangrovi]|uniref:Mismatch-specific DNA-glycosylase n=1 Tax=Acuticoccus mangrovi TaxID=2796142 RepID=A0A934IQN3_9HYPH|nr:mismatch-specific DNA-glycosylase [Acuticoccus mangrovi]MBJ3776931.1 mismatch-specific DNA-glycosylase [Acuticoccus mangrovi]
MSDIEGMKFGALPPGHVPDLLAPGLRLVFCGTALGRVSAKRRAYYAHPGNLFWRALHDTGLTPTRFRPEDWPHLVEHGIGLTDVVKSHFGNDAELPVEAFDGEALRAKILRYRPHVVAFTSKKAASAVLERPTGRIPLGFQAEIIGDTRLYVLTSPSGQARGYWDLAVWQRLADAVSPAAGVLPGPAG